MGGPPGLTLLGQIAPLVEASREEDTRSPFARPSGVHLAPESSPDVLLRPALQIPVARVEPEVCPAARLVPEAQFQPHAPVPANRSVSQEPHLPLALEQLREGAARERETHLSGAIQRSIQNSRA